jgi:hypothetical protein
MINNNHMPLSAVVRLAKKQNFLIARGKDALDAVLACTVLQP